MVDTLTIVSLEPMKMVTQTNRTSLRAHGKSGLHNVPGRKQEVSRVVQSARPCVICQHSPSATRLTTISATNLTVQLSVSLTVQEPTARKDTMIKLHSALC